MTKSARQRMSKAPPAINVRLNHICRSFIGFRCLFTKMGSELFKNGIY